MIPLHLLLVFPKRAEPAAKEWRAGLAHIGWVRQQHAVAGRAPRQGMALADGACATVVLWRGVAELVTLIVRTACNRRLCLLPPPATGRGRPRRYGDRFPQPRGRLTEKEAFRTTQMLVQGW
ncbi:transposase [Chloroflexus sp.]|uniref:transposase n=1 Tax=Chloroflexus sp. TaxID=1904827 RepID=UPI002ADE0545|nr:transposase [Chloroflexus sp.]